MATPKKKKNYTFLYTDGSYVTYELTKEDYSEVQEALEETWSGHPIFVPISIGIVAVHDIRSIIEQKEVDEEPELDENGNPVELPIMDQESYNWYKEYMGGK
jgi:hypothetical protein